MLEHKIVFLCSKAVHTQLRLSRLQPCFSFRYCCWSLLEICYVLTSTFISINSKTRLNLLQHRSAHFSKASSRDGDRGGKKAGKSITRCNLIRRNVYFTSAWKCALNDFDFIMFTSLGRRIIAASGFMCRRRMTSPLPVQLVREKTQTREAFRVECPPSTREVLRILLVLIIIKSLRTDTPKKRKPVSILNGRGSSQVRNRKLSAILKWRNIFSVLIFKTQKRSVRKSVNSGKSLAVNSNNLSSHGARGEEENDRSEWEELAPERQG